MINHKNESYIAALKMDPNKLVNLVEPIVNKPDIYDSISKVIEGICENVHNDTLGEDTTISNYELHLVLSGFEVGRTLGVKQHLINFKHALKERKVEDSVDNLLKLLEELSNG